MSDLDKDITAVESAIRRAERAEACGALLQKTDLSNILTFLKTHAGKRNTFTVIDRKTGKEADTYEIALKEDWAKGLCYCDMEGFAIEEDGTLLLVDECGKFSYCDSERFEVVWDEES